MSHSTVEKQRRDRINSLIDELREIVPARAGSGGAEGADSKRPKHIVLSDTIALVKLLQLQGSVGAFSHRDSARHLLLTDQISSHLPLAPEGAASSFGIIVEEGDDLFYVKVHCKDRQGLLLDIVSALANLKLQVATAAVTTTRDGNVFDVFAVRKTDEAELATAQQIQHQLQSELWPSQAREQIE